MIEKRFLNLQMLTHVDEGRPPENAARLRLKIICYL